MKREQLNLEREPIRGSVVVLIIRLLAILLFFELIFLIVDYIFTLGIPLPFDLHHHVSLAMFVALTAKLVFELSLLVNASLAWSNTIFCISGKHIIKRIGIFSIHEEVFQFDEIRSIAVTQSFFGKIFQYGDIILKISASGGYQQDVRMIGIANPRQYEEALNTYF
ncbi:MAG: PH domain-containing protein [Candidatus Woesebacteria bacterium]